MINPSTSTAHTALSFERFTGGAVSTLDGSSARSRATSAFLRASTMLSASALRSGR
ncbi:hypothetical protein COSO111634_37515 [Corallococcus soli]